MLVFISDLHLRDDPRLSVPPALTRGFLTKSLVPQVHDALQRSAARDLELVFLGDIFDINRSPFWSSSEAQGYFPWSMWQQDNPGTRNIADPAVFEQKILAVINDIALANKESLDLLRQFKDTKSTLWDHSDIKPTVTYHFVAGNHDRLAQHSPKTRKALVDFLALDEDPVKPFPWIYANPSYSVLALHGHLFDPHNFGGDGNGLPADCAASPWYNYPPLGDAVTVLFGQQIVQRFRSKLHLGADHPLVQSLAVIDEIRPQRAVLTWLNCWLKEHQSITDAATALEESVLEVIEQFFHDQFVKSWLRRSLAPQWKAALGLLRLFRVPYSLGQAVWLFDRFAGGPNSAAKDEKGICAALTGNTFARWRKAAHPEARYLVVGHTHRPLVLPLEGRTGDSPDCESVYFNTGTWTGLVDQGRLSTAGFARRSQVTHITFYKGDEDVSGQERSRWEFWTGSLRRGPAALATPPPSTSPTALIAQK